MKNIITGIVLFLTAVSVEAAVTCAPVKHVPKDELDSALYKAYTKTGMHLNSFPSWSGEDFFIVGTGGKEGQFYAAIAETYWGESCRVTRKLLLYDKKKNLLGYYSGLSERPNAEDLKIISPPEKFFFDGENYSWVPQKASNQPHEPLR